MSRFDRIKRRLNEIREIIGEESAFTKELFDSIDWGPFDKYLNDLVGTKVDVKKSYRDGKIEIESGNLIDKSGVFQGVCFDVRIKSSLFGYGEGKYGREAGFRVSLRWDYKDRGSNSAELFECAFLFDENKWMVRPMGETFMKEM